MSFLTCSRTVLTILLSVAFLFATAQSKTETIFYDNNGIVCDSVDATTKSVYIYDDNVTGRGIIKRYDRAGILTSVSEYSDIEGRILDGLSTDYYNDGSVKEEVNRVNNKLHGLVITYYPNGQMKRKDYYGGGEFVHGKCFTETGADTTHFEYQVMPKYPGGDVGLYGFINSKIKYPKRAMEKGIEGKVIVRFVVDLKGNVVNPVIANSVHPLLDEEALRIVKLLKGWDPGYHDGEKVKVWFTLPILFQLN